MTSAKKRIATYAVAATAALSGGIGGLLVAFGPGAAAQTAELPTTTAPPAPSHHGLRHDGVARPDDVAVAAEAIGITAEELRTQLQGQEHLGGGQREGRRPHDEVARLGHHGSRQGTGSWPTFGGAGGGASGAHPDGGARMSTRS